MFLIFLRISASNVLKMFLFKNVLFSLKLSRFTFDHSYNILSLFSLAFGYYISSFLSQDQGIFACAYKLLLQCSFSASGCSWHVLNFWAFLSLNVLIKKVLIKKKECIDGIRGQRYFPAHVFQPFNRESGSTFRGWGSSNWGYVSTAITFAPLLISCKKLLRMKKEPYMFPVTIT